MHPQIFWVLPRMIKHSKKGRLIMAEMDKDTKAAEELKESVDNKKKTAKAKEGKEKKDTPSTEELLGKIAELEAAIKEKDDQHLRMAAEYDNFRRRSREEKEATYSDAVADTFAELLPIIDNLERAAMFEDGEKVKEGLVMTAKSVEAVMSKLGIESMGTVGDTFDPNYHNAVLHDEDESRGEAEITDVFQKGYKKGKKIIRFAMVKTVN